MRWETKSQQLADQALAAIEEAEALDGIAKKLQEVVTQATSPTAVKNLLSGVPIGHPVHPPLTDLVIGAFTSATLLDVLGGRRSQQAADLLIGVGLMASLPTVSTGANDWTDTLGETRRVGVAHAASNTLAAVLYGSSLVSRRRGRRAAGVALGVLGWAALTVGGTLGGHLAYRRGIGVDENAFEGAVEDWQSVIAADELREHEPTLVDADGVGILLYRSGERTYAIANRCGHLGGPLHEGHIHAEECQVSCPWHHSTFDLTDGSVVRGPANAPQPHYETRVHDGMIEVRSSR